MTEDPWLTPEEVAARFKLDISVIDGWRRENGRGPDFVKFGKHVRYRESAVVAFEGQAEAAAAERRAS